MQIRDLKELAKIIKEKRKSQKITQTELAAACGIGVRYIVDLEKAKESCQIGKALRVIQMLGIKLDAK